MAISKETIKKVRKNILNRYGKALADKASNEFCLAFGLEAKGAGLEAFSDEVQPRAAVLEFARPDDLLDKLEKAAKKLVKKKEWKMFREVLGKLPGAEAYFQPAVQMLRQAKIQNLRDDFQRIAGSIKSEVERSTRGFQPGPESLASPTTPSAVTERCWLNRTMRTWVAPNLLAEIMADDKIDRLDVPRRLEAEMLTTMQTVAAREYRVRKDVTGKGVIVAVIDTEVSLTHPALADRVIQKKNYCLETWGNPAPHGTAVAGIIAANDAGGAFAGIAPDATIYNYKILATDPTLNADDFGGALAIQEALEDGAHIANCSWGGGLVGPVTSREAEACNMAWALGMSIVKSAGNRGLRDGKLTTPGEADGVIVVGATGPDGLSVQGYSSRGPAPGGKTRPHVVAPGGLSSPGLTCILTDGGFDTSNPPFAGTSFAAPHIAGMLALLLEERPDMMPDDQRSALIGACRKLDPHDENFAGEGLVTLANLP
jgi:serine protease AprX